MRTAVNVFSDTCCAVIVATTEGETGLYGKSSE
jgi:Na+/H+-dicarboxylate symporter